MSRPYITSVLVLHIKSFNQLVARRYKIMNNNIRRYFYTEFLRIWSNRFAVFLIMFGLCIAFISTGSIAALQIVDIQVSSGTDDGEEGNIPFYSAAAISS